VTHVFHFFLPEGPPAAVGDRRSVTPQDARRIERVLRLRRGEQVAVAETDGRVWSAVVGPPGEVELVAVVREPRPAPPLAVRLALAGPRSDTAVEKLVELGVERIGPLETAAARRDARTDRWQRIAEAAACQARRPRVPRIEPLVRLPDAFAPGAVMLSHEAPSTTLHDALAAVPRPVELLVGPEAGFLAEEHEAARAAGVPIATLGDVLLRTETAAIAAAVLALDRLGGLR
jgi:16S rRNA (uracil1498-N3)-methyltransferase